MKKYTIYYGGGTAILYTPHGPKERFYKLAGTCFGIRKSIMCCEIRKTEEAACDDYERLEFGGDVYVWREDGARKALEPAWFADDDWDTDYCKKCKWGVANKEA